jgi:hypothetical protein
VKSHNKKLHVIALKYENESEYRYLLMLRIKALKGIFYCFDWVPAYADMTDLFFVQKLVGH